MDLRENTNDSLFWKDILKDAIGTCVNLNDIGAGWQHGDDAVSFISHFSGGIQDLRGKAGQLFL